MTEYEHVTDDMEAVVEATELPPRLKTEVYETLNQKADDHGGITIEQATDIVTGVENRYLETRVDPLEPVGTVSAQSIGEPGTQMSVPYDERVVVRQSGETEITEIGSVVDDALERGEVREVDGHEVGLAPDGLETLSLADDETVRWKPVERSAVIKRLTNSFGSNSNPGGRSVRRRRTRSSRGRTGRSLQFAAIRCPKATICR